MDRNSQTERKGSSIEELSGAPGGAIAENAGRFSSARHQKFALYRVPPAEGGDVGPKRTKDLTVS